MNASDPIIMTFGNSIAYFLDNPVVSLLLIAAFLTLYKMVRTFLNQKEEIKKLSEENLKLTSENQKLQVHAKIGESLITTVNAFKS